MKVRDPAGQVYRVTRRWVPWQRRSRKLEADLGPDVPGLDGAGDDPISLILGLIGLIIVIPFLLAAVAVVLITGIELILLTALLPFAIAARVVFGRHWTVEVRRGFTPIHEERAGDWQASGVRIKELVREIEVGGVPADTLGNPRRVNHVARDQHS